MALMEAFVLIVTVIGLGYYYFHRKFNYWSSRGMPFVKAKIPFGSVNGIASKRNPALVFQSHYQELKKKDIIGGIYIFAQPIVVPTNLDLLKNIFVKDFQCFHDRGLYSNPKVDPLSGHLVTLEGAQWKNMRSKLTPTFTSGKMKMMHWTLLQVADQLKEYLIPFAEEGSEIEFKEVLAKFTTDVIGNVAFGIDVNSLSDPDNEFRKCGRKVGQLSGFQMMKTFFATMYPDLAKSLQMKIIKPDITKFIMKLVKDTIEYREKNNVQRNDFMNLLLQIKNTGTIDGEKVDLGTLTIEEIAAQTFIFFVAGFETSSSTMTFALYELALNPDIQEKARKEVQEVLEKHNGKLTYEAAMSMNYLEQVIYETLRKYPIIPNLMRQAGQDYKVPNTNHIIDKGVQVIIPIFGIHRDPEIYPDPDTFDPDRFTPENIKARHPFAWLPFGEGPRNCIGMRFGLMESRIGLAQILNHFVISPTPKTEIPVKFKPSGSTLIPEGGMFLKIESI